MNWGLLGLRLELLDQDVMQLGCPGLCCVVKVDVDVIAMNIFWH